MSDSIPLPLLRHVFLPAARTVQQGGEGELHYNLETSRTPPVSRRGRLTGCIRDILLV